jgi:hypothetical protein
MITMAGISLPHTDRQEFYNDFNDYVYSIKAPKNYVVYATGDLLNPDEVLQPEFAARLKKSYTSDEVIHVATEQEMKAGKVTSTKRLEYLEICCKPYCRCLFCL